MTDTRQQQQNEVDQNPRIRPSATHTTSLLDHAELRILERAAAAGGCCSISGLAVEEMVHPASVALMLQWRGLVRATVRFTPGVPGQPELVACELTEEGLGQLVSLPAA